MERHIPPQGQSLIGKHLTSKDCPCKPRRVTTTKAASSGRYGRHQGYSYKVEWHHNFIPEGEPFDSDEAELLDSLIQEHRGPDGLYTTRTTEQKED